MASTVYACFKCRTTQRNNHYTKKNDKQTNKSSGICTHCGQNMDVVSHRYRVPKKSDNKGWKEYEEKFINTPYNIIRRQRREEDDR